MEGVSKEFGEDEKLFRNTGVSLRHLPGCGDTKRRTQQIPITWADYIRELK